MVHRSMWSAAAVASGCAVDVRTDRSASGAVPPVIAGSIDWPSSVGVSVTSPLVIVTGQRVDGRRRVGEGLLEFAAREGRQCPQRRRLGGLARRGGGRERAQDRIDDARDHLGHGVDDIGSGRGGLARRHRRLASSPRRRVRAPSTKSSAPQRR